MAATLESLRERMDVKPTEQDKGLTLTLQITAYDNGLISIDGRPVSRDDDPAVSWLHVNEVTGQILSEFYRRHRQRLGESKKVS